MPRIPHQPLQIQRPRYDPYQDSDEESSVYSSQYSYSQSSIPSRSGSLSMSISSRQEVQRLMRNRDAVLIAELQLEEERKRGRWMLLSCFLLGCFCMILFRDRWPDDLRSAMIEYLSDDRTNKSQGGGSYNRDPEVDTFINSHSDGEKKKKKAAQLTQYSRDDPASGTSTYIAEEMYKTNQKSDGANSKNTQDESTEAAKIIPDPPKEQLSEQKEAALMEELEQHLDNLSKFLKWNLPYQSSRDLAVFWAVPNSGAAYVDDVLGKCYGLVQAADHLSVMKGHEEDKILNVVTEDTGKKYVNVNLGDVKGIKRAKQLRLATSNVANLVRSPYVYEIAALFTDSARYAKCFTMIQDPIDRAVDVFRKLKATSSNEIFKQMTLEEYAKSGFIEDNWMVRVLSNEMNEDVGEHHLDLARHVLGRKCLIGLTERFEDSIKRFSNYFDWGKDIEQVNLDMCQSDFEVFKHVENKNLSGVDNGGINKKDYAEGTELYNLLKAKNELDFQLYKYAESLYGRQSLYS